MIYNDHKFASTLQAALGDASPEGQDLDQEEGGSSGDTDCHDTHPNADSGKLREEKTHPKTEKPSTGKQVLRFFSPELQKYLRSGYASRGFCIRCQPSRRTLCTS